MDGSQSHAKLLVGDSGKSVIDRFWPLDHSNVFVLFMFFSSWVWGFICLLGLTWDALWHVSHGMEKCLIEVLGLLIYFGTAWIYFKIIPYYATLSGIEELETEYEELLRNLRAALQDAKEVISELEHPTLMQSLEVSMTAVCNNVLQIMEQCNQLPQDQGGVSNIISKAISKLAGLLASVDEKKVSEEELRNLLKGWVADSADLENVHRSHLGAAKLVSTCLKSLKKRTSDWNEHLKKLRKKSLPKFETCDLEGNGITIQAAFDIAGLKIPSLTRYEDGRAIVMEFPTDVNTTDTPSQERDFLLNKQNQNELCFLFYKNSKKKQPLGAWSFLQFCFCLFSSIEVQTLYYVCVGVVILPRCPSFIVQNWTTVWVLYSACNGWCCYHLLRLDPVVAIGYVVGRMKSECTKVEQCRREIKRHRDWLKGANNAVPKQSDSLRETGKVLDKLRYTSEEEKKKILRGWLNLPEQNAGRLCRFLFWVSAILSQPKTLR